MNEELRILLVEDQPTDAELEIRELRRAGLRVSHRLVETEEAFRQEIENFRPQLIISDFSMPHFDGMWALSISRDVVPDVPFIFVSGTIGEEYAIRALKNGATDYVLKNNLVRLPSAVERALQERELHSARRKAEEEIRHQRAFLRQIIDLDRSLIFAKDREGRFILVNQAVAELFGITVDAMLGKTLEDFNLDKAQVERLRDDDIEVMRTLREKFLSEDRIVDAAGRERWFQIVKRPIVGLDGKADMVLGVATDITERKSQELKIARLSRIHAVLSGINSAIVRIRDRRQLFEEACRIAVEHGGFGIAWIGMLDPKSLVITPVASAGLDTESFLKTSGNSVDPGTPLGRGMVGTAVRENRAAFSNDLAREDQTSAGARRKEALRRGYRSVIVLPLLVEGAAVGNLSLFAREANFFDDEEIKLLKELSDDISFALENMARQQRLDKLSRVRLVSGEINSAIVRVNDQERLLEECCRIVDEHGKFEMIWIGTVDVANKLIKPVAWKGFSPEIAGRVSWKSISTAGGTLGEAALTGRPSVRNDIGSELAVGGMRGEALRQGLRSTICLPLVVDSKVVALVSLFAAGVGFFDEDELALLNEVAADVSFALQSMARREQVDYLSYYDRLTGLPNRALFNDRLEQRISAALDGKQEFSVMLLDVERFKLVNDTLGRPAGDELLRQVSRRLREVLQPTDLLAHFGSDHFGVATRRAGESGTAVHLLEQVLTGLSGLPFQISGSDLRVAVKAGVSVYPADGTDVDSLIRNAEAALKNAKKTANPYQFYAPQMNARVAEQLKLESDLRNALQREQFVLHYQPKFDLASGKMVGTEALIRWMHPERGMVPPGQFIQVLEETGMILEVGRWALRRAALEHAAWCEQGFSPPRIAVNVSQVQLRRKDFVDYVRDALADVSRAGERVDIEITESMLMEDVEGVIAKLQAVQEMGLNIAVDDFGTGYSSLSYLARLPIDSLKIDRSFIVQMPGSPEQMAIVATVISLARALNLKVVAEGVETEEQASLLRLLRCDEVQGYLFGRPMPPGDIEKLLPRV